MKEIRIFLASSYELEPDRARIGNLIRRLNDAYEERFIHLHLVKWEDTDSFYNQSSKQLEYDYLIRQCELFVGLFWHRAGKHTVHEVEVARGSMRPENILVFKKNAPFRADHEGSEDVRRFLEKFPDEVLKDSEAELCKFLEKQDSFFPYDTFAELEKVLSEKLKDYCASLTVTEEEKARTYSGNTLQIHVAASPEVEPDMARLGDLVRYLDENSKQYCRIKMIDVLPGSDMFVSMCHTSAPADLRKVIDSAIRENENSGKRGKPRLYFCMKYLGKDDKKDQSLEALEDEFRNTLSHYPDRYTHAPEMKLHFMLQLERLQRETVFSEPMFVVKDGVICLKTCNKEQPCPLLSCEDMMSLQKDSSYQMMKQRLHELDAELDELKKQDRETEQDLSQEYQRRYQETCEIRVRMAEKQRGYLNLARKLEEMIGQEQDETIQRVRELYQVGEIDRALELLPPPEKLCREYEVFSNRQEAERLRFYQVCELTIDCLQAGNAHKNRNSIIDLCNLLIRIAGDLKDKKKEAFACFEYAYWLNECKLNDKALEYYDRALTIFLQIFDKDHPSIAACYNNIGETWKQMGNLDKTLEYYGKALAINLRAYPEDNSFVAINYIETGDILYAKGNYDKALEYYDKALTILLHLFTKDHPSIAICYNEIGAAWSKKGYPDKALIYFEKALAIRLHALSKDHPSVVVSYNNIGEVWKQKNDCDKALIYFEKALAIQLDTLGKEHPKVASCYNRIGEVWRQKKDYDKALIYFEKALAIRLLSGKESNEVASVYYDIGTVWENKNDFDKALEYLEKALSIYLHCEVGECNPGTAICYQNIGDVYCSKGDDDKALEYYEKAISIYLHGAFDVDHLAVALLYKKYEMILRKKGDNDKASDCFDKAMTHYDMGLPTLAQRLGEYHPDLLEPYLNTGNFWYQKGNWDKALEYSEKSLAISLRTFGENNQGVAGCYYNLGNIWLKKNDCDKALKYYEKSLSICLSTLGENHPYTADCFYNTGFAWFCKGDYDKSLEYLEKTLSIRIRAFGEDNPSVVICYKNIGIIYKRRGRLFKAFKYSRKAKAISRRIK